MAMTVYAFDERKRLKIALSPDQLTSLVHDEGNGSITATLASTVHIKNGEYIGFTCMDGLFRLFEINKAAHDDDRNTTEITATDAAIADLKETIIEGEVQQLDASLVTALQTLLPAWTIEGDEPDRLEKSRAYYTSAWAMVETYRTLYEWRILPHYRFDGGAITAQVLRLESDEATFRGRILYSKRDASKVYVTKTGRPITRLYGLGPAKGSGDVQTNMTFADAVWSVSNGDPVDKPKGQTWVEDPEAVAAHGIHTDTVSITSAENENDLLKKTWDALQEKKKPSVNVQATVADMEIMPGYEHQQIRLGDLVAVRLKTGETVEARIIAIKRDYIRPWLTTITAGDKKADIVTQVSTLITNAAHTFERLTIFKNRFRDDETLIQLNALHIQLNADTIIEHAQQILLMAESKAEKDQLNQAYILIDGIENDILLQAEEIKLKADKTYVDNLVAKYIETDELEAKISELGYIDVDELVAGNTSTIDLEVHGSASIAGLNAGTLSIGGSTLKKNSINVITSIVRHHDSYGVLTGLEYTQSTISYWT